MATYAELRDFYGTSAFDGLAGKVAVAVLKKVEAIGNEATPTAEEIAWAKQALANPRAQAGILIGYILAVNDSATITQITNATDAAIQANVDSAVDKLLSL